MNAVSWLRLSPRRFGMARISREKQLWRVDRILVVLALVAALGAGWASAHAALIVVAPLIFAALVFVLAQTRYLPYALVLVAASTFTSAYALPRFGHLYPAEALAVLGLVVVSLIPTRSFGGGIGLFLTLLLCAVFGGILVARANGIAFFTAVDQARPMILYTCFWIALAAVRASWRRFCALTVGFAVFITALSLAQWALPGRQLLRSAGESFVSAEGGFTRVRPPGLILVYFVFIFSVACLAWGPRNHRARASGIALVTAIGILLSLNRNMIVGAVIGFAIAVIFARRRGRAVLLLASASIAATLALTFFGSGAIGSRILSLGNPNGLQQSTLADREYENREAVPVIKRHALFGIGWGANYGALISQQGTGDQSPRGFIHNQYYGLWLRTGIVGLAAYLALLGWAWLIGVRWLRSRGRADAWIGAGMIASVVGFAASSIVGIYVIDAGSAPVVAGLLAVAAFLAQKLHSADTAHEPGSL